MIISPQQKTFFFFSLGKIKEFTLNRGSEIFHQIIQLLKKLCVLRKNSL